MLRLGDIMTRDVVTIDPELSIRDAMELLAARHIGGAPVIQGSRLIGVVSLTDLANFAASLPGTPTERPAVPLMEEPESPPIDGDEPEGLFFTDLWSDAGADVVERFASVSGPEWNVLEEHTVGEAMTREIHALPPTTDAAKAAAVMTSAGIHRVLVMEGERLRGIVSLTDIARASGDHKLTTRTYVFGRGDEFDDRGVEGATP